ncbi:hypothetical protein AKJ09_00056 [Labilithrix luteola]|uniref:Uncharacterized protein n=1 Tax=Labilithrix luteola TaxID=1391654 RepID=A0A0K1PIP9_9BACT|nr:hypothetical protein [Labilithrix luteola]AKU93392.1 hypothetical protein AKJ09_00056 [Labilithrix luteola]
MALLSIDPGNNAGWATFDATTGDLQACGKGAPPPDILDGVTVAVIEHPVIYPGGKTKNPNDIVKLAVTAGTQAGILMAHGVDVRYVTPREWKGTLDKDACCRRVWSRLTAEERALAARWEPEERGEVKDSKTHTLDAIGIGLNAVGRFKVPERFGSGCGWRRRMR